MAINYTSPFKQAPKSSSVASDNRNKMMEIHKNLLQKTKCELEKQVSPDSPAFDESFKESQRLANLAIASGLGGQINHQA